MERATVDHVLRETADLPESAKPLADHLADFEALAWERQRATLKQNTVSAPVRERTDPPRRAAADTAALSHAIRST